eukprot:1187565-Prorocentrum_minimum.AAC.4
MLVMHEPMNTSSILSPTTWVATGGSLSARAPTLDTAERTAKAFLSHLVTREVDSPAKSRRTPYMTVSSPTQRRRRGAAAKTQRVTDTDKRDTDKTQRERESRTRADRGACANTGRVSCAGHAGTPMATRATATHGD